ncbi:MAG: hypothetical protein CMB80_13195 [Flammeovirgaceae bacterium]|nr:hypothetical protein [Flammeovirgaceae bacterium]MBR08752.1 hypothetical protein [Rickettsiales bacterium]HCX24167.1 hypothetical protein [Cytophagales bacterium]|tara:strand:+ start:7275 stop:8165 length:891 start_codon:yes stop_codon:yes gene_type:complete
MAEEKEKKYRRISWIASISVQLVLLLLFYFLIAWREPDPPIPSYGIELAFGLENVGSGPKPVTTPEPAEEITPEEEASEESAEETLEENSVEEPLETESLEEPIEEIEEVQETPVTEQPSPTVVEEVKKPVQQPKKEVVKEEVKKTTPKPEVEQPEKSEVQKEALMPKAEQGETNNSSGETANDGRQGKEEGTIDGRALMGDQGSSNGASLQMAGWVWDFKPDPKDNSSEEGKIVYRIKVDGDGYIVGIELISSTVSPSVERYYRQSIERLSFSKTNDYKPAPMSTGTITFIIKSK